MNQTKDFQERVTQAAERAFEDMARSKRYNLGTHKRTILNEIFGKRARSNLLHPDTAQSHAKRLEKQFHDRWGGLATEHAQERLRFVTVLDSVVYLDVETIVDAAGGMASRMKDACGKVPGIELIAAVEVEIVNLKKMKQLAAEADEARKWNVIQALMPDIEKSLFSPRTESFALVHLHGVVDLGQRADEKIKLLRERLVRWWPEKYLIELKRFHSNKTTSQNLSNIADYMVKGGNENLIYKIGFGYDAVDKLERQMSKAGFKRMGIEPFPSEMSLSRYEIEALGSSIDRIMGQTKSSYRNGYLIKSGQKVTW